MTTPEPIEFPLPPWWHPLAPHELGLDVAFLAIRLDTHGSGFTATVVVESMTAAPGSSLTELADEAAAAQPTGMMTSRSAWDGARGPRLRQVLHLTEGAAPKVQRLVRVEEYAAFPEGTSPSGLPVLRATSTATLDQADEIAADFERMLSALYTSSRTDGETGSAD